MLNNQSPVPLYSQLADILMDRIRTGEYPVGNKIPAETELADYYKIGRPTVRQAIDFLVRRHLLVRRRGSGTYVCDPQETVDLFSLAGTTAAFQKKGTDLQIKLIDPVELITVDSDKHHPFHQKSAWFFSRVSRVDSEPVLYEEIYLNPEVFRDLNQYDFEKESLARLVAEKYHLTPESCRQHFQVGSLTLAQARILQLSQDQPILKVFRYLNFPGIQNGIFSILYCRTDRYVFSQTITGNSNE